MIKRIAMILAIALLITACSGSTVDQVESLYNEIKSAETNAFIISVDRDTGKTKSNEYEKRVDDLETERNTLRDKVMNLKKNAKDNTELVDSLYTMYTVYSLTADILINDLTGWDSAYDTLKVQGEKVKAEIEEAKK